MTKGRWIALIALAVTVPAAFGLGTAFGVKRVGGLDPVQGLSVAYCTDPNELPPPAPPADCSYSTTSTTWKTLPGATITVDLPADRVPPAGALILARLSGQARCIGGPGACVARIVLEDDGGGGPVLLKPTPSPTSRGLTFDSTGIDGYESHMIEQVTPDALGPGTYTVSVQVAVAPNQGMPNPTFRFDGWTFTTEVAFTALP